MQFNIGLSLGLLEAQNMQMYSQKFKKTNTAFRKS